MTVWRDDASPVASWTERRRGVLAALVLLLVGLFAARLGIWDAVSARDLQYRLLGTMFTVAGITMVAEWQVRESPEDGPSVRLLHITMLDEQLVGFQGVHGR